VYVRAEISTQTGERIPMSRRTLGVLVLALSLLGGVAMLACNEDDAQEVVDEFLATETPEAAATAEPEATEPGAALPAGTAVTGTTRGACKHIGPGDSQVSAIFEGFESGQVIDGTFSGAPADGLVDPPEFSVTADAEGNARTDKKIQKFGEYTWMAEDGAVVGSFTVEQECPPE
jgi:hypothetical protein